MAEYLTFEQATTAPQATPTTPQGAEYLTFEQATGVQAPLSFWDRFKTAYAKTSAVTAPIQEQSLRGLEQVGAEGRALANMLVGLPGGVAGVSGDIMSRVSSLAQGVPPKEAGRRARAYSDQINRDWGKITSTLGLSQDATGSKIEQLLHWAMEASDAGGEKLEKATNQVLTLETTQSVRDTLLNALGVRGLARMPKPRPSAVAEVFEKKTPVEPSVEPLAELKPTASAAEVQAVVDAALAARSPLETAWLPKKTDTPANLAWQQTVAGLIAKELPTEGPGITPKTRLAEPAIIGEPPAILDQALQKLRDGLLITKEEAKAVRSLTPRPGEGVIVDSQGRSIYQRGAVDPTLLKVLGLMGFSAVAAKGLYDWYNSSDVSGDTLRDVGLGLGALGAAGVMKGETFTKLNPAFVDTVLKTAAGEIAPLYHGGKALEGEMPSRGTGRMGEGLYLTDSTKRASGFGREGSVYPIYANLRNPITADAFAERFGLGIKTPAEAKRITEQLRQEGYDGVVDKIGERYNEVVVFEPTANVRSAISGQADPKLLAGLAAGAGLAAYALSEGEKDPLTLSAMGLAGTMALGKSRFAEMKTPELVETFQKSSGRSKELAAAQIYENTHRQLTRSVQSWGRDLPVEDIVQQTYEKAFNAIKRGEYTPTAQLSTWLYAIAKNEMREMYTSNAARAARKEVAPLIDEETQALVFPEKAMLEQSPELYKSAADVAAQNDMAVQMQRALDKLSPDLRRTFELSEFEGLTDVQIAQELGIQRGTARSRILQARQQLQNSLRGYKDLQAGKADVAMLAGLGAVAGGATLGAVLDPEHPIRAGIYGALAGGVLATGAGRGALKAALKSLDPALGVSSTRIGNIAPSLKLAWRNHEMNVLKKLDSLNDASLPFLQAMKKLTAEESLIATSALLNGRMDKLVQIPSVAATFPQVQKVLHTLEAQLQDLGRFAEGVGNYFPRIVKDFEGLKQAMGQEAAQGLERALLDAEASMIRKQQRSLTDVERSIVTNRYLFAEDQGSFLPGYAKARRLREIPDNLLQFYEPPTESLLRYLSGAVNDIEAARFFGRDLKVSKQGKQLYTDVDGSIGNLTERLLRERKITQPQAMELRDLLKARFEGGEKAMHPALAATRNITNTALLGNIASAATQLGDSLATVFHHSLVPTLQAVTQKIIGQERITPKQLGLVNHVAEELSAMGFTGRLLHTTMKWSGFHAIDMFAKGLGLNASLIKNEKLVSTPEGVAKFRAKYQSAFGDATEGLIKDLQAKRPSDAVESLVFSELSDAQPISKAEMPEIYLTHPNGRILYQLKTYLIKQIDIVRRDAYQEIAKGTPEGIMTGTKNLAALATMYALANVPGDAIKDWLAGRPIDLLSTPKLVENVLQTFGINRYAGQQIMQGKVVETATGMVTPPVRVLQDIAKLNEKSVAYVPLAGRVAYDRWLGGNERREIFETQALNRGLPPEERKPLSPEARKYLSEHRKKKEVVQ